MIYEHHQFVTLLALLSLAPYVYLVAYLNLRFSCKSTHKVERERESASER